MYCINCGKEMAADAKFCPNCGYSKPGVATAPVATASNAIPSTTSPYHVTPIGTRFLNSILDSIVLFAILMVLFIVLTISGIVNKDSTIITIIYIVTFIISVFSGLLYYVIFEWKWGRTPAKWLTKTKVVMRDGSQPGFWNILGRTAARYIPYEAISFFFNPIGWHDSLSGTLVVPSDYTPEQISQIQDNHKSHSTVVWVILLIFGFFFLIAIIGMISSIVLLGVNSARTVSRDAQRVADVRQLQSSLELYHTDKNDYPNSLSELAPDYIGTVPTAPEPADGDCGDNNTYTYNKAGKNSYKLRFCIGQDSSDFSAGTHYITPSGNDKEDVNSNDSANAPQTEVEKADYEEGYKSGYLDGRSDSANLGDNYYPPATVSRRPSYIQGYKDGLMKGCDEGDYDCSEGIDYLNDELSGVSSTPDSQVQSR